MIPAALSERYPDAPAWPFGDSPELADELAALVIHGQKRATCSALVSFLQDENRPVVGGYSIILDGRGNPVCVIRTISMTLIRFCDVTESLAATEGEGDLSLAFWRDGHRQFFTRAGTFSEDMELVFEAFTLTEVL